MIDHTGGNPAPPGVHSGEAAIVSDEDDRGAITHPCPDDRIGHTHQRNVTSLPIATTGPVDDDHPRAVHLVEHAPGTGNEGLLARREHGRIDTVEVEVAVDPRGDAHDH